MLFNSIEFAVFLPIVCIIYWFVVKKNITAQNIFIIFASYVFYGWWDWRFLSLIVISSSVDYFVGIGFTKTDDHRKRGFLLLLSIFVNIGFLAFFKYFNFFADNFSQAFTLLGNPISTVRLNVILPVGISFYTFQTLSYSIDTYKRKLEPTKNIFAFFAFVSFFPQLVAGPIERASNLLPQFFKKRIFDHQHAIIGLRQILWGLFKKIVIADNCAEYANHIFNNSADYSGSTLLVGAIFFAFQIYGDFSGYSDIAIGTSRLFGFNLMRNFSFPYFSRDIAEFWRRWHISLSTWFRDYLYIPLGGNRGKSFTKVRNIFIIFLVSGFWHGANWTFIIWGALNAIYFIPLLLLKRNRNNLDIVASGKLLPTIREFISISITFLMTTLAWIFFRAENVGQAFTYISDILTKSLFSYPVIKFYTPSVNLWQLASMIFMFIIVEWLGRENKFAIEKFPKKWNKPLRWAVYYFIVVIIWFFAGSNQEFIYFQF